MSSHSNRVLTEFFNLCNDVYDAWRVHLTLFGPNPRKVELEKSPGGKGLTYLSIITQEYSLHQIAKLHDEAIQRNEVNLTIEYMLRFVSWDAQTLQKLEALRLKLDAFARKLKSARNKVLSHNDLESILNAAILGEFPAGEDIEYFKFLQEFVNVVSNATIGEPMPFCDDAAKNAKILLSSIAIERTTK